MIRVRVDLAGATDAAGLHSALAAAFQFPPYYGANFNALFDCLSDLSGPGYVGQTGVGLDADRTFVVELGGTRAFAADAPALFLALLDTVARVNREKAAAESPYRILVLPA